MEFFHAGKSEAARIEAAMALPRMQGSQLEEKFLFLWKACGGSPLLREFMFHPFRKWRADFTHVESRTIIEIEGGIHIQGRHNTATGFTDDCEKYMEAVLHGWRVIRLVDSQLTRETVERLVAFTFF
ncbi:hypothetical protein [Verrucomicrobium sp. BvORR106]|uniref:hypothetical protein n=1 Tax=Verrucomicrobium sp. BvORR106 TaxID=1403819 RepID=UPI00068E535A|nr:hypothetical protein [Verrucomicrobium sp. BvORR106]